MKSGSGFFTYAQGATFSLPDGRKKRVDEQLLITSKHDGMRSLGSPLVAALHRNLSKYRFLYDWRKPSGGGSGSVSQQPAGAKRGGKKHRKNTQQREAGVITKWCKQAKTSPVLVPTDMAPLNYRVKPIASECLDALRHIVGRATKQVLRPVRVDAVGMLLALETGNDPTPYIDRRVKGRTINVVITADISGSCQQNSPYTQSMAMLLADAMGEQVQVYFSDNFNGLLVPANWTGNEPTILYPDNTDVVIYFGDDDCLRIASHEAEKGTAFIGLSCYNARQADGQPHLKLEKRTRKGGCVLYYDRISITEGIGIAAALKDAAKKI